MMFGSQKIAAMVVLLVQSLSVSADREVIYKNKAEWAISWTSSSGGAPLTREQIFVFENAASGYFMERFEAEEVTGLLAEQHALATSVNVIKQEMDTGGTRVVLSSVVDLTYLGHREITRLASILEQMTERNEGDRIEEIVQSLQIFDSDASSFQIAFEDPDDPSAELIHILNAHAPAPKHSGADKGLIVACTFLSLALVIVSSILLWAAGGFENLWIILKQRPIKTITTPYGFKSKKSKDADDRNGNGIIGAEFNSENMAPGVTMTPHRGVYREEDSMFSPLSQITNTSNYTDTSRAPLGIRSASKLGRYSTPKKSDDHEVSFQITRMSYT